MQIEPVSNYTYVRCRHILPALIVLIIPYFLQVMKMRSEQYGPVYRERIGHLNSVVITDLEEYNKVIQNEGRCPVRAELAPLAHYRKKKGMSLGTVNS